jgi:transposase
VVDAHGIPLAVALTAANVHDSRLFAELLDLIPPIHSGGRGHPRWRPEKVHADKGYDYRRCRAACTRRGITPRIARRGIESRERLGRYRWVVERTQAWYNQMRRLVIRYERRADIHEGFLNVGSLLICWSFLHRFC